MMNTHLSHEPLKFIADTANPSRRAIGSPNPLDAQGTTYALSGKWHGSYGIAFCPAHSNTRTPALSLRDGHDGRLLAHCHAGCSFKDVVNALRALGIILGNGNHTAPNRAQLAQRAASKQLKAETKETQALNTWRSGLPITGTLAESYLRGRGIICDLPDTLRFHPECWHPTAKRFPAMVGLVEGLPRAAIHRTYLRCDGSGKAHAEPSKAMQGATRGGAVRVAAADGPLVVAEGIETALSLPSGLLRTPATVWAALSASGLAALQLPSRPHRLTIAADGDPVGQAAANRLAERAAALGWTVSLLTAPQGRDWNDVLIMKGTSS